MGDNFPGKTYRLRICNVGLQNSLNFRIQGHKMKLVEVEGTHTIQTTLSSLDIHVGQSYSVLVTADQRAQDYYIAVSSRFTTQILNSTAILHYRNSKKTVSGPPPPGPTADISWSLNQARSIRYSTLLEFPFCTSIKFKLHIDFSIYFSTMHVIHFMKLIHNMISRTNLTASGPRPNPQGSYHYGQINVTRTIRLANHAGLVDKKQRYAVNGVSFIPADTPLKLADYYNIDGVFKVGSIQDKPTGRNIHLDTAVMGADYRAFVEIVFENRENIVQSWHLDGYSFFVVG